MLDGIHHIGASVPHQGAVTVERAQVETSPPEQHEPAKSSAASAIYYSPAMQIDPEANMAIFVVRNSETGAVINQYPSKKVVEEYKRADTKRVEDVRTHSTQATSPEPVEVRKADIPAAESKPVVVEAKPVVVEEKSAPAVKETV